MAELKEITLPINVVFSGEITVKATSTEQAWLLIQQHVFAHLGEINTDNDKSSAAPCPCKSLISIMKSVFSASRLVYLQDF